MFVIFEVVGLGEGIMTNWSQTLWPMDAGSPMKDRLKKDRGI